MGTRNITSVIMNNKQVVCQYGQWDGYPSYTGVKVLEFLRDADLKRFKNALANTKISVSSYDDALTYTGSTKDVDSIFQSVMKEQSALNSSRKPEESFIGTYETVKHMLDTNLLTPQQADDLLVSTRDTGCEILSYIYDRALDRSPLQLFAIEDEYNGNYSFDIQGIYIIDLDKMSIRMQYNGYAREYSIHDLPQQIDLEMQIYEEIAKKIDELRYEHFDFSVLAADAQSDVPADQLKAKATELAMKVAKEINEQYPELLSDKTKPLRAEDFGFDYICTQLCKKALACKQTQKSDLETLVQSAQETQAQSSAPSEQSTTKPEPDLDR